MLRLERIKDYLLLEEEFLSNQEALKPREEKELVSAMPVCLPGLVVLHVSSQL